MKQKKKSIFGIFMAAIMILNLIMPNMSAYAENKQEGRDISSTNVAKLLVSPSKIDDGGNTTVRLEFDENGGNISEGDRIHVTWDSSGQAYLSGYKDTIPLIIQGKEVAKAVITNSEATITFNSKVDNLDDVEGWIEFKVLGRNLTDTSQDDTKTVSVQSGSKRAEVSIHKGVSGRNSVFYYKTGDIQSNDIDHVRWFLAINNEKSYVDDRIYIEDSIQSGQILKADSFVIYVKGHRPNTYYGENAIANFERDYPGSSIRVNVSSGEITVNIPRGYASLNNFVIMYKTKITNKNQDTFENNTKAWYKENNKPAVNGEDFNFSVANIHSSGGITGTVKGELKIFKSISGTQVGIPKVKFELKRKDGGVIKDNEKVIQLVTDENGIANVKKLPVAEYIVKEISAPEWIKFDPLESKEITFIVKDTDKEGTLLNIENNKKLIDVKATKIWDGGPVEKPTIYFKLYRSVGDDTTSKEVTNAEIKSLPSGTSEVTWNDLEKTDDSGEPYNYSVKEVNKDGKDFTPNGYVKTEKDLTVTNTYTEKTSIDVTKKWIGKASDSVTVNLMADGKKVESQVLNEGNEWQYTFSNLEKYKDGKEINYAVKETPIDGYKSEITGDMNSGFVIKNTNIEKISIPVNKVWVGKAGKEAEVTLLADNVEKETIKLTEETNWNHTFTELPKYDEKTGKEINYTLAEKSLEGYSSVITGTSETGFTVTNTITGKTSVGVTKKWIGKAADSVTVNLMADGKKVESQILNEGNEWQYTFSNLEKYKDGKEIKYTVEEIAADGYKSEITGDMNSGFVIKNTNIEKISIPVNKVWIGKAGKEAEVTLLTDNVEKETIKLTEETNWKHTFTELPKYDEKTGKEINYTLAEKSLEGYSSVITGTSETGFTVTNTITGKTSVGVTKKWIGKAADSVTVNLMADGKKVESQVLNEGNEWQYTFSNLEKYKDGKEIKYTVEEIAADGYKSEITGDMNSGFVIKNTNIEKISIPVNKVWIGKAGKEAEVTLLTDNVEKETIKLTEETNWKHTFTELPKYDEKTGKEINYTLAEKSLEGYSIVITGTSETGFTVTNTITGKTSVGVTKKWIGKAADSVTVNLMANGKKVESQILNEGNKWQYTFSNLEKYKDGKEINYTVEEIAVDGYKSEITGDMNSGFVIKNTNIEKISIPVNKVWVGKAGKEAEVTLLADNVEKETIKLTEETNWKHTFTELPKYDEKTGKEINYTLVEKALEGYSNVITGTSETGFTVTNTITGKISVGVTKVWKGGEEKNITVILLANGKEIQRKQLSKEENWQYIFSNLEKYTNGKEINYTVKEAAVEGYDTTITGSVDEGYLITNTKKGTNFNGQSNNKDPNSSNNNTNSNTNNNINSSNSNNRTTPATKDAANILFYLVILLSSIVIIFVIQRKKNTK
ncbi:Cna B-type domain-containing protein [Terrisporobacter hibernicus]|uniref:Cna B-type domain-containing protein n=1 Tax=Terrisporobacter hibernicus TaxID=2813371 RepID=A0AAX2ZHF8_9FIRM|nr:Cna B-type domain-containing protein [Terrisporobacter hibernicus]UEL47802.1 Cna B-type domain-containing protein [Terrisporobacter hibernicus]